MKKPTLYFPGLRPDDYLMPENVIYRNTPLSGIQKSMVVKNSELIFYYRDESESDSEGYHANSCGDPHIFSPEEFAFLKKMVEGVQGELNGDYHPRAVYGLLARKAKDGNQESVLLFHRLDMMFTGKGGDVLKYAVEFIRRVMEYKL